MRPKIKSYMEIRNTVNHKYSMSKIFHVIIFALNNFRTNDPVPHINNIVHLIFAQARLSKLKYFNNKIFAIYSIFIVAMCAEIWYLPKKVTFRY